METKISMGFPFGESNKTTIEDSENQKSPIPETTNLKSFLKDLNSSSDKSKLPESSIRLHSKKKSVLECRKLRKKES